MLRRIEFNDLPLGLGIEKLIDLIVQSRPAARITDYPNILDLHELLSLDEVRNQTIVWVDPSSEVKAYCILDPYNNLLFDCASITNYSILFNKAVEFCIQCMNDKNKSKKNHPTLDICCWGDDHQRIDCIKNKGFKSETIESVFFKRPLKKIPHRSALPPGFFIRPLAGEQEINAYVELHQRTFGTSQMTTAIRHSIMASPEYDPQLDLVVQTPEGRLVAFCVCQINEKENIATGERSGLTDPIGVHPEFRNLGLAKALIIEGLVRLKLRGMDYAKLGTTSDNFAMIQLAETLGFLETGRKLWFSKQVRL